MPENFESQNKNENEPEELTNQEKLLNTILDKDGHEPEAPIIDEEQKQKLNERIDAVLNTLTDRERDVIKKRHGLNEEGKIYTLEELGKIFGVTREAIRIEELKAMRRLKLPLKKKFLEQFWEK